MAVDRTRGCPDRVGRLVDGGMNKQHILDEIRRTANANGGKALGHREFGNLTGIKEQDWSGRYWARWSDAVREAGLEPNAMTVAYPDDAMMEKLAQLARQLGRFPVWSEVALARRQDATFPTEKTYRRFGSKAKVVQKLAAYCEAHPGFQDVVQLCKGIEVAATEPQAEDPGEAVEIGFVYLMKYGRQYKIGRSENVVRRGQQIGRQLPDDLTTVHVIRTDDPPGIESYWHRRFAGRRKAATEWFELSASDVSAFRRRKFM